MSSDSRAVYEDGYGGWVDEYGEPVPGPNADDTYVDPGHHDGEFGTWSDGSGGEYHGAEAEASVLHYESTKAHGADATVDVASIEAEAYYGEHGYGAGFEVNAYDVKVTGGEWDPNTVGDSRVTLGASVGAGASFKAHEGTDYDGDGYTEQGYQVAAGPVTVGYSWEQQPEPEFGYGTGGEHGSAGYDPYQGAGGASGSPLGDPYGGETYGGEAGAPGYDPAAGDGATGY